MLGAGLAGARASGQDGQFRAGDWLQDVYGHCGRYIATEKSQ